MYVLLLLRSPAPHRGMPGDDQSFYGDDREIHGDAGHRRQDDRGPGDIEAQRTCAGNDDLAEDAARPSEVLPHDRADQTQGGPYLEGREEVWQGVRDPDEAKDGRLRRGIRP